VKTYHPSPFLRIFHLGLPEGLRDFQRRIVTCPAFLTYGHFALTRSCSDRFRGEFRWGWNGSLHNAAPLNNVVPAGI
jgi:hypothetical protein